MAPNGIATTEPKAETARKDLVPPVPIEILEDPWTPAAEVAWIAAALAQRGYANRRTCGRPA
jgi:hypothetical protein